MRVIGKALTFDDVLLIPERSSIVPKDVNLKSKITKTISLSIPLVSAAMDTVTEANLAIAIAQEGGMGIIHKNLSPESQALEVAKVKRFESGVVKDPITIQQDMLVRDVLKLIKKHNISGLPVVNAGGIVGIITNRDLRFEKNLDQPVSNLMTPRERLITVMEGTENEEAMRLMHHHRLERVLVVDNDLQLKGLITAKDILKSSEHPNAAKDKLGQLLAGAAVGVSKDTPQRVEMLIDAGVDLLVVDTAHGYSESVLTTIEHIKLNNPTIQVIGGNIATSEAARAMVGHGVDGVKVGIGPGSICTTRVVAGVGVPQITAIESVVEGLVGTGIPLIADGGIRYSGDIAKAIAAGADSVMLGGMFAGTEEAPGEIELYQGRSYKSYRGMGSISAMQRGSADRYFQESGEKSEKLVPEGVEGRVPYKGSVVSVIKQLVGGLKSSMGYLGCLTISEVKDRARFVEITAAGVRESHVHDVQIVKEAPNYRVD